MKQLRILVAAVFCMGISVSAQAQGVPLSVLSAYLNSFKTAEAAFTQINGDGTVSTGKLFIKRPGRARFEYAAPDKSLILSSGGKVAVFDPKSNQAPSQYPLKRTPLNLILARKVNLGASKMVIGRSANDTTTTVIAQDPKHPDYGSISLVFTNRPVQLREWVITDNGGGQTRLILGDLKTGMPLVASLFSIPLAMQLRVGSGSEH